MQDAHLFVGSSSAWLKLGRAREHRDAVEDSVEEWLSTDAFSITREVDRKSGETVRRVTVVEEPPARISILAGDVLQNLRAALDHAVYTLAERHLGPLPPDVERRLMFPIVGIEKGDADEAARRFHDLSRSCLRGVPADACSFIESEQPYTWGKDGYAYHWLWVVHDLSRIDRHRRLAVSSAFLDLQFVTTPAGVEPRVTFKRAEGPVQDGDELVRYSGADEGVEAHFTREVTLNEGTSAQQALVPHLANVQDHVEYVVGMLERHLAS